MKRLLAIACLLLAAAGSFGASTCMYNLPGGIGHPWGIAANPGGGVWFAEAGCELTPACPPGAQPGQLGLIGPGMIVPRYFTLPNIPGNQPAFVAIDGAGKVWFTTPGNDMIGEFDPVSEVFVGQWRVAAGSRPWDLVFSQGALWYTAYGASAIGRFDPAAHTHAQFRTPSPNSQPYGIASGGPGREHEIWFTENNASVARIGMLDMARGNRISEYPIRATPSPTLTPHLITIDGRGRVWWTEGFTRAIGELDADDAFPGSCGTTAGTCAGVTEHLLPPPPASCSLTHVSGIAADRARGRIWFDDSLSSEIGYFDTASQAFTIYDVVGCGEHPHDGLTLDRDGQPWWNDEFANAVECCIVP